MRQTLPFVVLTACGGTAAPPPEPPANPAPPRAIARPACTHRETPPAPLTREELEREAVPEVADVRARLRGVWDGHAFLLDGELGQPGSHPTADEVTVLCFEPDGRVTSPPNDVDDVDEDDDAPRPAGCTERSRRYAVRRGEGGTVVLELRVTGGCPGDAGYAAPYVWPLYVHRLDDRYLVLVDGVTAAVTGFRRR